MAVHDFIEHGYAGREELLKEGSIADAGGIALFGGVVQHDSCAFEAAGENGFYGEERVIEGAEFVIHYYEDGGADFYGEIGHGVVGRDGHFPSSGAFKEDVRKFTFEGSIAFDEGAGIDGAIRSSDE